MEELKRIQSTLNAPKNLTNNFGHYNYRSCEGILESLKPLLSENECTLTLSDEIVEVGGRIYVKSIAALKNKSGEKEETAAYAREEETKKGMDAAQITGSASSYARKYALNGLFCIDDTKDPDATNKHGKEEKEQAISKAEKKPTPAEEFDTIIKQINSATTAAQLKSIYNSYPHYQTDERFLDFLSVRKTELGL